MTKKELIEWLAPYPDDILILTGDDSRELRGLAPAKINVFNQGKGRFDGDFLFDKYMSDIEAIWL